MATQVFTVPTYAASASLYVRLFDDAGQVFDFNDDSWSATLAGATTPHKAMTEKADMDGTGYSGYVVSLDLERVNAGAAAKQYVLKVYSNATPAAADVAVTDGVAVTVQLGELGEADVIAQPELSVKSTSGLAAQVSCWLERGGERVSVTTGGTAFTAATTDTITSAAHGLSDNDVLLLTTTDTLPAGLSADTPYYVISSTTDTFSLSTTEGGSAVDITDTGTGTHYWHRPTAAVTVREHGSGANLFSCSMTAADLVQGGTLTHVFEAEQSTPNFTDDRQYTVTAAITLNGVTTTSTHNRVVIG